jgi:hypothetical protein
MRCHAPVEIRRRCGREAGLVIAVAIITHTVGSAAEPIGYRETVVPFFRAHCAECHLGDAPEADFSVARRDLSTDFSGVATRRQWREVLNVLNAHSMPPEESPQPSDQARAAVVDWITAQVTTAERAARATSPILRRLNRSEYRNTIRDLVGIDFDVSGFPQDPPADGFDNNGGALTLSPLQDQPYA